MGGNEPVLDVGACTHLGCTAQKDPHLSGAYLPEKLFLPYFRVGVMDKGDLLRGHSALDELAANILVDCEPGIRSFLQRNGILQRTDFRVVQNCAGRLCGNTASLAPGGGCGNIAEDQLRQLLIFSLAPELQDIGNALVDFCAYVIRQHGVNDPLIEAELAPVRGNLEHVVLFRVNSAGMNLGGTFREGSDHSLLNFRGLRGIGVILYFRGRQIQLIGGLNVGYFLKEIHELR